MYNNQIRSCCLVTFVDIIFSSKRSDLEWLVSTRQSEGPLVRRPDSSKVRYSEGPIVQKSCILIYKRFNSPKDRQSEGPIVRRSDRSKTEGSNSPKAKQSEGSIVRRSDSPKVKSNIKYSRKQNFILYQGGEGGTRTNCKSFTSFCRDAHDILPFVSVHVIYDVFFRSNFDSLTFISLF